MLSITTTMYLQTLETTEQTQPELFPFSAPPARDLVDALEPAAAVDPALLNSGMSRLTEQLELASLELELSQLSREREARAKPLMEDHVRLALLEQALDSLMTHCRDNLGILGELATEQWLESRGLTLEVEAKHHCVAVGHVVSAVLKYQGRIQRGQDVAEGGDLLLEVLRLLGFDRDSVRRGSIAELLESRSDLESCVWVSRCRTVSRRQSQGVDAVPLLKVDRTTAADDILKLLENLGVVGRRWRVENHPVEDMSEYNRLFLPEQFRTWVDRVGAKPSPQGTTQDARRRV